MIYVQFPFQDRYINMEWTARKKEKLSCELTNEPKLRQLSSENHYAGLRGRKDGNSSSEKKEYDCKGLLKHSYTKNLALVASSSQEEYDWKRQMIKSTTSCVYKQPFTERLVKLNHLENSLKK